MRSPRLVQRAKGRRFLPRFNGKLATAALLASATLIAGCDVSSFIDPTEFETGQNYKPGIALQKPILTSLSSIDKSIDDPNNQFESAQDVKPEDLQVISTDYTIGRSDLVQVEITGLSGDPAGQTVKAMRVSESGNISLPLIGQVHAEGLTEAQLEQAISDAYRNAQIMQSPQVTVQVTEAQARSFSVLGAVNSPGKYAILQADFRLLDALVTARDVLQSVDTVYVIREVDQDPENVKTPAAGTQSGSVMPQNPPPAGQAAPAPAPGGTGTTNPPSPVTPGGPGDTLAPHSQATPTDNGVKNLVVLQAAAPAGGNSLEPNNGATPSTAPSEAGANGQFQFNSPQPQAETRIIRIPLDQLRNGDLRYNIVIRPHDLIIAPLPTIGEYYMGGHVSRVGVYSLTARKITLKQAIIGAGMLDGLGIPQRTDLIRRLSDDREVFVRVDLTKIFGGSEPDIYLKPYDQVMVGTNVLAPFIAAIRGGFRITYGFGFLYDRNYAPEQPIE